MSVNQRLQFFFLNFGLLSLLLTGCTQHNPAKRASVIEVPQGWFLSANNSSVTYLQAKEEKQGYKIDFKRTSMEDDDAYYIQIAESIFPNRKKIRQVEQNGQIGWYFERKWWFKEHLGYRIPYALTGDTVNFYLKKYQMFKKELKHRRALNPRVRDYKDRVEFSYIAKVIREQGSAQAKAPQGSQRDILRVQLKMKWYLFCGQPCGWGFEKTREVIFSGRNKIIEIRGDGASPVWISSPETRYAPHQWISM